MKENGFTSKKAYIIDADWVDDLPLFVNTPVQAESLLHSLEQAITWMLIGAFKGVQEEIPLEEASTLQIGSVAFPPGQCTSQQLHPCHRLFDRDEHQDSFSASL